MLLLDGRLKDLRGRLEGDLAPAWRRLHEQCDWYRTQTPPAEHPAASITYFGPAAMNLALAYRLTGQPGYLEEAWRWISTAVSFPHWGKAHMPDHDLDAGWLLHGLSLAYDWLRDDLAPGQAAELRAKLELQGERMYEFAVGSEGGWWSSSYWQNHNWICYTGLATAGYALGRRDWTERAKANFAAVVDLMPVDGSNCEGVVYWRYGVPWIAIYLDLLADAESIRWWDRCEYLANTFSWRVHQAAPGFERIIDHGDCHDRRSGHSVALYRKLAAEYRIGEAQWLADLVAGEFFWREAYASGVKPGVKPEAGYELLWYDPSVTPVPVEEATPTAAFFPDLGLLAARTDWSEQATMVSFKASPGGGHSAWERAERFRREQGWDTLNAGHHHPDSGSFVLVSHGEFLAVDDGYCNRKRAAYHNLVLVDGQGWADEDRYHVYKETPYQRQARMRDVLAGTESAGWAHATAETRDMFDPALGITRLDRTLVLTPAGRLVVLDDLAAETERVWTFLLHADWPFEPDSTAPDRTALRAGPAQAWITRHHQTATETEFGDTEIHANPTSSTPTLAITKRLRTLRASTEPTQAAVLLHTVEPTSALRPAPATAQRLTCARGHGVTFGTGPARETVLLAPADRRIETGPVVADAAAVLLAADGDRLRLGLVAARRVVLDGTEVFAAAEPRTELVTLELPAATIDW